jgi:hypothetical protein
MKPLYLLLYSVFALIPLQGAQQRPSFCQKLSLLAYKATSLVWRCDYFYLAYVNSTWYLKMKLQSKEQIEDINRYYLHCGTTFHSIDGRSVYAPIYIAPLHEAIRQGHLDSVVLLCNAGADKTLRIKSHIEKIEAAKQDSRCPFLSTYDLTDNEVQQKIAKLNRNNYVGLSALELAEELLKKEPKENCDQQKRRCIYQFLKEGRVTPLNGE